MASISSTNSTSSLGNTSLRGFGGMVSGIDRDSIIEQMTLATTTKINNQKRQVTQLQWKQEAYMDISDKIIDLTDKYASYSSASNLKDPTAFAKNLISVHGKESSTSFVTATGTSDLINNVTLTGVEQLATSSVRQSSYHVSEGGLKTTISDLNKKVYSSNLEGRKLDFALFQSEKEGFTKTQTFTFDSSYEVTDDDGKTTTHYINYTPTEGQSMKDFYDELEKDLNTLLEKSGLKFGDDDASKLIEFKFTENSDGTYSFGIQNKEGQSGTNGYVIKGTSTALGALGYVKDSGEGNAANYADNGISLDEFNKNTTKSFDETGMNSPKMLDYLTEKKLTFNYDGSKKEIELVTKDEAAILNDESLSNEEKLKAIAQNLQNRLDKAYGKDAVKVGVVTDEDNNQSLTFTTPTRDSGTSSTISVISNDYTLLKNLGLEYGSSNKINLDGKLSQDALLGKNAPEGDLDLVINGVAIKGLTSNSSISDILSKINATSEAGVKATYVDATGQFMLVSSETGQGREITLGRPTEEDGERVEDTDSLAWKLFGGAGNGANFVEGQNAKIHVSYGNGMDLTLERASNTFDLEGLSVTVSGVFGGSVVEEEIEVDKTDDNGNVVTDSEGNVIKEKQTVKRWEANSSEAVTFSAKADVDAAVEKVKAFFEDFNALVTTINGEITTRPDSDYQPLTDEQKAEMDETSIENWEKKAKQGLLYGDSIMRDLSMDVQSIFTKMMSNGASYEDLKEIGITYSEDYSDGGTLVFDETAFRTAMENNPEKVSRIFAGGNGISKGLINVVEDTFTPYATRYSNRNGGSYGRLVEVAGTNKKPTTLMNNEIYKQLKEMQATIDSLNEQLQVEQDRYISQFTTMETLINQMNTQSSYLSQITG